MYHSNHCSYDITLYLPQVVVTPATAGQVAAAGATALVAGSAIFNGDCESGYRANIDAIRAAAKT